MFYEFICEFWCTKVPDGATGSLPALMKHLKLELFTTVTVSDFLSRVDEIGPPTGDGRAAACGEPRRIGDCKSVCKIGAGQGRQARVRQQSEARTFADRPRCCRSARRQSKSLPPDPPGHRRRAAAAAAAVAAARPVDFPAGLHLSLLRSGAAHVPAALVQPGSCSRRFVALRTSPLGRGRGRRRGRRLSRLYLGDAAVTGRRAGSINFGQKI